MIRVKEIQVALCDAGDGDDAGMVPLRRHGTLHETRFRVVLLIVPAVLDL